MAAAPIEFLKNETTIKEDDKNVDVIPVFQNNATVCTKHGVGGKTIENMEVTSARNQISSYFNIQQKMNQYSNTSTSTMDYVTYYIYICEGSILFTMNILLVIFICSIKEFRVQKEFIIYVGVLLYDAFFGLSHVFAGSIRIQVFLTEKFIPLYTPWMCFNLPQVYLWTITTPATGIITIVSAIDRFISIMYPLTYYQLRTRYSYFMISTPFLISAVFVVIGGFQCYELRNLYNIPMTCALYNGQMPGIYFSLRFIRTIVTFIATLLYIPIVIKIYFIIGQNSKNKEFNDKQRKNIFRATVTVGLLVINEIICFVVPDVTVFIDPTSRFQYLFNLMNLNKGFISVILLLIMQRDLRRAILWKLYSFFCCVKLPSSLFAPNSLSSHGVTTF